MNKYLEKIASKKKVGTYAIKQISSHNLVDKALDIKGRADDIRSLHSRLTTPAPNNKHKKKHAILTSTRHRSNRKTA